MWKVSRLHVCPSGPVSTHALTLAPTGLRAVAWQSRHVCLCWPVLCKLPLALRAGAVQIDHMGTIVWWVSVVGGSLGVVGRAGYVHVHIQTMEVYLDQHRQPVLNAGSLSCTPAPGSAVKRARCMSTYLQDKQAKVGGSTYKKEYISSTDIPGIQVLKSPCHHKLRVVAGLWETCNTLTRDEHCCCNQ